ncbi:MAG: heparan-alpha-glucosaminide N-acetyltransferase [Candidatus Gracilibacteria bacterium]|nr:heparan-alpha-glucosaminide N-acetyltransferase [Candidatus Gracilibacteria bacterium]
MRLEKLDVLRGVAVILMIFFHINYSLVNIFNINLLNFSEIFWVILGKISVFLFIFISGIGFFLAEKKYKNEINIKYIKISCILGIIAGFISLITYFLFDGEQFIKFGIIHFFSLSFLILLIFRKFKLYNLLFGTVILIYGFYFIPIIKNEYLYFLGFMYPGFNSADYYPLLPYFGVILYGYTLALLLNKINKFDIFILKNKKNILINFIGYLGKKSLIVYLIHQPIIILVIYIFLKI